MLSASSHVSSWLRSKDRSMCSSVIRPDMKVRAPSKNIENLFGLTFGPLFPLLLNGNKHSCRVFRRLLSRLIFPFLLALNCRLLPKIAAVLQAPTTVLPKRLSIFPWTFSTLSLLFSRCLLQPKKPHSNCGSLVWFAFLRVAKSKATVSKLQTLGRSLPCRCGGDYGALPSAVVLLSAPGFDLLCRLRLVVSLGTISM